MWFRFSSDECLWSNTRFGERERQIYPDNILTMTFYLLQMNTVQGKIPPGGGVGVGVGGAGPEDLGFCP